MTSKQLLPVWITNVECGQVFQPDGQLREKFVHARSVGVVRIIAGPTECHVCIDIQRPWTPPLQTYIDVS